MANVYGEQINTRAENHAVLVQTGQKMKEVLVDSGNVDSGSTPTSRIREGNVLVKRTSTGRYIEANDSNGDRNLPPVVTASETADTDWDGETITLTVNGVAVVTVTLGGADDTDAEVVTALNANATFRAHAIATAAGSRVVITGNKAGEGEYLKVTSSLATAFGASGTEDSGSWADYGVLAKIVDLLDEAAAASHSLAPIVYARGRFKESLLVNLTADARAALIGRGCTFE